MSLSIQTLIHSIFHRDQAALQSQLALLNEADLHRIKSTIDMNEHEFHDQSIDEKEKISFVKMLELLHRYQYHQEAANLLDRFHDKVEYHELLEAFKLQLKNRQTEFFKKSFNQYGKQKGLFYQLASDILSYLPKEDVKSLFEENKEPFVITKLDNHDDYVFLQQYDWLSPSLALLIHYAEFYSEEFILLFLKIDELLLHDLVSDIKWFPRDDGNNRERINFFHHAIANDRVELCQFLFQHAKKLVCEYRSDESTKPYWLLAKSLRTFNLILQHEGETLHYRIKRDYYKAYFKGIIGNIPISVYEKLNENRYKHARQLWWMEEDYFADFSDAVNIIESILAEGNPLFKKEIEALIKDCPFIFCILNAAIKHHATRVIDVIARKYTKDPVRLMRCLAPLSDLSHFKHAEENNKLDAKYKDNVIRVAVSLLATKLTEPLLILIKNNREQLFSDKRFLYRICQYKNPTVLLACLKQKFNCSELVIIPMAAFAWMTGDKNTAVKLIDFTSVKDEASWKELVEKGNPSTNNLLWAATPSVVDGDDGLSFTQNQYKEYQRYQAELTCFYLNLSKFSFKRLGDYPEDNHLVTFDFLGKMRSYVAFIAGCYLETRFGCPRQGQLFTPFSKKYYSYYERGVQNYLNQPDDFTDPLLSVGDDQIVFNGKICWKHNEKNYTLTVFSKGYADTYWKNKPAWHHTDPKELEALLKRINFLICELLGFRFSIVEYDEDSEEALNQFIIKLATIHWLLAHATPCQRGSASISESICAALMMYVGYSITYTHQVDCEALSTPNLSQFQKAYPTFFTRAKISEDNQRGFEVLKKLAIQAQYKDNSQPAKRL